jgi:hypothetical protein
MMIMSLAGGPMSNLDELKLAFTWHAAMDLISVDDDVDPAEVAWITRRFTDRARAAGLVDNDGRYLPRFHEAVVESLKVLPGLPRAEKVGLLEDLVAAVLADGVLAHSESERLKEIMEMLGLAGHDLDAVLGMRDDAATIDPGIPERD